MPNDVYQEWLNRNSSRKYPFDDDADMSCKGGLVLPDYLILDARVCVLSDRIGDVDVTFVTATGSGVYVGFRVYGLFDGSEYALVSATPVGGVSSYRSDVLDIRVVSPRPSDLPASIRGTTFNLNSPAKLLPGRTVRLPCGSGCDVLSCGGVSASGDVVVADGHNTTLRILNGRLSLRAGVGMGKGPICDGTVIPEAGDEQDEYQVQDEVLPRFIYYINGQKADSDGGFQIYGGDGIAVSTGKSHGIPAVFVRASAELSRV